MNKNDGHGVRYALRRRDRVRKIRLTAEADRSVAELADRVGVKFAQAAAIKIEQADHGLAAHQRAELELVFTELAKQLGMIDREIGRIGTAGRSLTTAVDLLGRAQRIVRSSDRLAMRQLDTSS